MTIDLDWMLDLRDAQVAADVQRMAELGWFDVEFTMYGCAYLDEGQRYYRLTSDAEKIYDFLESYAQNNLLPSRLTSFSARYPVPVGMQDVVTLEVKKALASQMQSLYPSAFFEQLMQLYAEAAQDSGYAYLLHQQQETEGTFQLEKLQNFAGLLDYIYACNKITHEHYRQLRQWYLAELKNIEDEPIRKDLHEKTFYGMAYLTDGAVQFVINARKDSIYKKKYDLLQKGRYTTPLYSQTYYYNHSIKLSQVRSQFEHTLQAHFTKEYIQTLQALVMTNDKISKNDFTHYLVDTQKAYGTAAQDTLAQYGYRWGILW